MALRLRRGTDAERLLITPLQGELIYTIDTKQLYAGDGTTAGGTLVSADAATTLESLTDTDLAGKTNGQVLSWNSSSGNWEPKTLVSNIADGVVEGSNYIINIVSDESTILVNSDTNEFTGSLTGDVTGNVTGNLTGNVTGNAAGDHTGTFSGVITATGTLDGDVTGSIFGDDSTLIVDGITNTITSNQVNTNLLNSPINSPIVLQNGFRTPVQITSVTDGNPGGFPYTEYLSVKGTVDNPQSVAANDIIGGWKISAWDRDSQQGKGTTVMASRLMADAVITDTSPNSLTSMLVSGGGTSTSSFDFYGNGQFKSPGAITPGVYANEAARDAAIPSPTAGMMIFLTGHDDSSGFPKFQGYTGSAWVDLN